jgi:hypothetical protein
MINEMYEQLRSLLMGIAAVYAVAFVAGAVVVVFAVSFVLEFLRFRGTRMVTCPETDEPALVKVDALHAAVGRFVGEKDLRLMACSRWQASQTCARECLRHWR